MGRSSSTHGFSQTASTSSGIIVTGNLGLHCLFPFNRNGLKTVHTPRSFQRRRPQCVDETWARSLQVSASKRGESQKERD
eukprot:938363-Prorocentrum_lima.AAC.1